MDDAGGGRRGTRPRPSAALRDAVERAYGLSLSDARDLGGSANLNLLARDRGKGFVVRVYREHVTDDRLAAVQRVRAHLAGGGLPCAVAVPARDGSTFLRAGSHLVEVEPYVVGDGCMDTLARVAAGVPVLARMHDRLAAFDAGAAGSRAEFANYVDPATLVEATTAGTDRIRSWHPTREERALADAADRLAERAAEAGRPFTDLPRQVVHGDFWDDNVWFRAGEVALVGDFDFMGERRRIDDLALTLFFTSFLCTDDLSDMRGALGEIVHRYDAATARALDPRERAALTVAFAAQPLWSIAVWAAQLDEAGAARRHVHGHRVAIERGLKILADRRGFERAFASGPP